MPSRFERFFGAKEEVKEVPAITTRQAILLLVAYTIFYVAPFYLSSTTRPSATLSRDAPSVIKGRIKAVTLSCILCGASTLIILIFVAERSPAACIHEIGYYPIGIIATIKSCLLTAILFLGPLFEDGIVNGCWKDWLRLRGFKEVIGSWIGWRNLVVGPITEEILFRSTSIPLLLLAQTSNTTIIFLTPLIFGLAHIHHFYAYTVSHPDGPWLPGLVQTLFQLSYTTLFGAYATFTYLRTGSLLAVVLIHAFCNWQGLPRIWGRLEGPVSGSFLATSSYSKAEDTVIGSKRSDDIVTHNGELHVMWTVAYYAFLVIGAVSFGMLLFPLTESPDALARF